MQGKFEFLADTPFKSIIFFYLGPSRATPLDLNNLFLIFLFAGFVHLIPYLSINKAAVFQPFYSIIFLIKDFQPNCVISSLYSIILPHNFALLFGSFFICGPTPLYRLMPEVIWFFGSVSHHSRYTPVYFLSSVSASVPHLSPGGFVSINLPIRPPVCASVGVSGFVDNWVESVEQEDFIEVEEGFGTPTPAAPRPRRGAEFIVEESQSEQSPPPARREHQPVTRPMDGCEPILVFPSILRLLNKPSLFCNQFHSIKVDKIPYM